MNTTFTQRDHLAGSRPSGFVVRIVAGAFARIIIQSFPSDDRTATRDTARKRFTQRVSKLLITRRPRLIDVD
jgi:hypothetical protein